MKLNVLRAAKKALLISTLVAGLVVTGGNSALAGPSEGAASTATVDVTTGSLNGANHSEVLLDSDTGAVVSVTAIPNKKSRATGTIEAYAISNPCGSNDVCWQPSRIPYAQIGFTSPGTYYGSWTYRGTLSTRYHTVQGICWTSGTSTQQVCNNNRFYNTSIAFTGTITGKKVVVIS
ncbi:hypothetical protein [Blastococcus sp. LR1]|uniref:hypothetical protein n=1 Tax=Blastococcus sp. LR1 TaxID=2877000 RepID=UPI001CCB7B0E|nr:hypothetical protein [Blastococcus sp. LR1]MCA0143963.1 hypothetical protein [Blastococcus sp. LR1]